MKDDLRKDFLFYIKVWIASDFDGDTCVFFEKPTSDHGIFICSKYGFFHIYSRLVEKDECKEYNMCLINKPFSKYYLERTSYEGEFFISYPGLSYSDVNVTLDLPPSIKNRMVMDKKYYLVFREI